VTRVLWTIAAIAVLAGGCEFVKVDPTLIYKCAALDACPTGLSCVSGRCVDVDAGSIGDGGTGGGTGEADGGADGGFCAQVCSTTDAGAACGSPSSCACGDCGGILVCGAGGIPNRCGFNTRFCNPAGWCWENPRPQGNEIFGLWSGDAGYLWAVGAAGTILAYDGDKWFSVPSPTSNTLRAISGTAQDDVWAVGLDSTVIRFNGSRWSVVDAGSLQSDLHSVFATPGGVWIGGTPEPLSTRPTLQRWNGSAFMSQSDTAAFGSFANETIVSIWGSSTNDVHAVTRSQNPLALHYDGTNWRALSCGDYLDSVHGLPSGDAWATSYNGAPLRYRPDSGTWAQLALNLGDDLRAIHVTPGGEVLAAGHFLKVTSMDTAGTWTAISPAQGTFNEFWNAFAEDARGRLWAAGSGGRLYYREDAGNFTFASSGEAFALHRAVWSPQADKAIAVGVNVRSSRSNTGAWTTDSSVNSVAFGNLHAISGRSPTNYHFVGTPGQVFQYRAGSQVAFYTITGNSHRGAWADADGGVLFAGDVGIFEQTADSGFSMVSLAWPDGGPVRNFNAMWGDEASVYAVGKGGVLARTTSAGWSLRTSPTTQDLNGVWSAGPSELWLVGATGTMFRNDVAVTAGTTTSHLRAVWGSRSDDVWIVGDRGTMFHWTQGALKAVESSTRNDLYGVFGNASGQVFVVGERGLILRRSP
jgi:hypothetical protein